jgi:YggT family protein
MDIVLLPLLQVIQIALQLFIYALIISAILSWLVAFNIINTGNQFVSTIGYFLHRVTEPALRPIRRIVPDLGGIDISPILLILLIFFLQGVLSNVAAKIIQMN